MFEQVGGDTSRNSESSLTEHGRPSRSTTSRNRNQGPGVCGARPPHSASVSPRRDTGRLLADRHADRQSGRGDPPVAVERMPPRPPARIPPRAFTGVIVANGVFVNVHR